jgi:hypothetical protein
MKRILSSLLVATGGKVGGIGCGRYLVSPTQEMREHAHYFRVFSRE